MQIWEMVMCVKKVKQALKVFLSLEGKAREAVLELDIVALYAKNGMEKVYEKLDSLFLEDKLVRFFGLQNFRRILETTWHINIGLFFINFGWHVTKLKDFKILLPEPVLAFRALKSANSTLGN